MEEDTEVFKKDREIKLITENKVITIKTSTKV
jgi:hypothetical protein